VGTDIGVIGGHVEAADEHVVAGIAGSCQRQQRDDAHQHKAPLAGLLRASARGWGSRRRCGRLRLRRLGGLALGLIRNMTELISHCSRHLSDGLALILRLVTKDACGLVSHCGHHGLLNSKIRGTSRAHPAFPLGFSFIIDRTVRSTYIPALATLASNPFQGLSRRKISFKSLNRWLQPNKLLSGQLPRTRPSAARSWKAPARCSWTSASMAPAW